MLRNRLSLFLLLSFSLQIFAAGDGGEAKPAENTPKDQREFNEKNSKLTSLTNRIAAAEEEFKKLIEKKKAAKGEAEKQEILKEMVRVSEARNADVAAYNKLKSELSYRYPNQGQRLDRQYELHSQRSVEELEGAAGLDELLTRTRKLVEKKYGAFAESEIDPKSAKPVSKPVPADEPKRLRLEK